MRNAFYITTKDFCKRAWIGASLAVGAMVLGPLLFVWLSRLQGLNLEYMEHELINYHFAYLGFSWIAFLAVGLQALSGSEKICRALPVSSRAIASWMMFAMIGLAVVLQLFTNGVYRLLFFDGQWLSEYWPLLGPLLFLVTLILLGHCFYWTLHAPSFTRILLAAAILGGLFYWFLTRFYPHGFKAELVPWSHVTLGEFVLLELVSVAAWYQGTRAFAQVRSGTAVPSPAWEQVHVWWNGLLSGSLPAHPPEPLSRRKALTKLHWRDSCYRAVIFSGMLLGGLVLVVNVGMAFQLNSPRSSLSEVADGFMMVASLACVIAAILIAFLVGEGVSAPGRTEMQRYLAMAPLTDQSLISRLFWNLMKTLVFTLAIIFGALILSLLLTGVLCGPGVMRELGAIIWVQYPHPTRLVPTVLAFWLIAANGVALLWTGRTWFIRTVVGLGFGGFVSYVIVFNLLRAMFRGRGWDELLMIAMLVAVYILFVGGTGLAYWTACRTRLLSHLQGALALLIWCSLAVMFMIMLLHDAARTNTSPEWFVFGITSALTAMALAPFATIPLALRWNRHR